MSLPRTDATKILGALAVLLLILAGLAAHNHPNQEGF